MNCFFLKILLLAFSVQSNHAFDLEDLLSGFAKTKPVSYNLPSTIVPVSYELSICTNFPSKLYDGEASINFKVQSKTNQVTLHSDGLNITSISILNDVSKLRLHNHTVMEKNQMVVIHTKPSLTEDHLYTVRISYTNKFSDDETGFYLKPFIFGNQTKWAATTQFEPIYARRTFPCFDEPHFKTPFVLHVARRTNQDTLSNLPLLRSETDPHDKNLTWDTFGTEKPIPTYVVSFMISDFRLLKLTQNQKLTSNVKRLPGASGMEKQLYKVMTNALYYLKLFTKIEMHDDETQYEIYSIPDSANFVLNNWEMKLYGTIAFHFPKKDPVQNKEPMALSVARQYARKLITERLPRRGWNYAWWNEALIAYTAMRVANEIDSQYRISEYFLINTLQQSFMADMYSFPMSPRTMKASAIVDNFDSVAVQRGAAILNMLEHTISPKIFQKGFNQYLLIGNNTNVSITPHDFYHIIDQHMPSTCDKFPISVASFMKTWTDSSGYPVISINTTKGEVDIKQEIYGTSERGATVEWVVPLTYTTKSDKEFGDTSPKVWLFPRQEVRMGNILEWNNWILLNIQGIGYYRVNYDYENWKQLISQLYSNFEEIDIINRAQLVDDILHLAVDERISFHLALTLTSYLKNEYDLLPWVAAINVFKNLILTYDQTSASTALRNYILDIFQEIYKTVGFYGGFRDTYEMQTHRPDFVYMACNLKLSDCVEKALEEFHKNIKDLSKIDVDLRETVFCTAAKHLNQTEVWIHLWNFYQSCKHDYERIVTIRSFKCFDETRILKKILYRINDLNNGIASKDKEDAYSSVFLSKSGTRACLHYLEETLSDNNAVYSPTTVSTVSYIINNVIIGNNEQLRLIENLLTQVNELNQSEYQTLLTILRHKFQESKETLSSIQSVVRDINSAINNINPANPPLKRRKTLKEKAETYVRREIEHFKGKQLAKNVFFNYVGPKVFGKYFRYISLLNFMESPIPFEKVIVSFLKRFKLPSLPELLQPQTEKPNEQYPNYGH